MLVVTRLRVAATERAAFLDEARAAVEVLSGRPGCLAVHVGRAVDDPDLWVLQSQWRSVGEYRRALSSFEVTVGAVPLLSRCVDEPSAFEVLLAFSGGALSEHASVLAEGG